MVTARLLTLTVAALALASPALAAQPGLSGIEPRGGQRGTEAAISFHGARLADAQEILFHPAAPFGVAADSFAAPAGPWFTVNALEGEGGKVTTRVAIAPECPLGEHRMRVRTATGISYLRTFWVGQFPSVAEKEPNSDFAEPQRIAMNVTVTGRVTNEDIDYYLVEAKKGQRLGVEVEAMRLGTAMFDPYVAILDRARFELSASDDTALLLQDSVAATIVPEDGEYVVVIREAAYGGSGGSRYRLHVGAFPRPNAIYPPGGPAGETLSVRFIGDMTGDIERTVTLPAGPNPDYRLTVRHDGLDAPSPNRFRVSAFGNVLETEPNDEREAAGTSGEGELPTLPQAFNGIIERDGDVDWYRFRAKKGQKFQVRLHARSVRSPLDGVLSLHRADGNQLSHNDDSGGPDSGFGFNVPADDEYFFRVHDHLMKGGPGYVYRIETVPVEASLSVRVPNFGRDSQARKTISVPRGNRTATLVTTSRDNVGGDLVFEAPGLPEGVVLHGQTIPSNLRQMPIVFEAAPEAPLAGALVDFVVRLADPKRELRGGYHHTIDLVLGAPNRTVFYRTRTATLPVAVTEAAPFSIELVPPTVPLVQNGSMNLKVVAHRREGFDNPITVRMLWKPPGIGASNTVQIGKGQTECAYPINANGGAQNRTWHIAILGEADANGQVRVSSKLTPLTVEPPYVGLKIEMAAYEQGEKGEIVCKIEHRKAFEGPAAIELLGLPAKVSTTGGRKITRDDEQIVFDVDVAKDSPPGKHNNLFCRLIVQEREAPILHNLGRGGVLRIDKPPPPKKNAPPKPKVKPKPKPKPKKQPEKKPEKRLTRLEKLRLQAKQRAEAMQ